MKTLAIVLLTALDLFSQAQLTLTGPTGSVRAGATVPLNVVLSGSSGQNIAALQATIVAPGGSLSCSAGSASAAASKQIAAATASNGNVTFILYGVNQNAYSDGVAATCQLNLPISFQGGTIPETLTGVVAASTDGAGVPITVGSPFPLLTVSPCAITGDNPVSLADVLAIVQQILAGNPAPSLDLNGDGVVNVIDVERVANAAIPGGACKVGQ